MDSRLSERGSAELADPKVSADPFDILLRHQRSIDEYLAGTEEDDMAGDRFAMFHDRAGFLFHARG